MNSLHIFVKVAETLNMTEAANELYISQPAVSKAVKSLETSLGVKLLIRDKQNKIKLTDAGKEIVVLARKQNIPSGRSRKSSAQRESQGWLLPRRLSKYFAAGYRLLQIKVSARTNRTA